ncbi:MAG: hypothetical protein JKY32_09755, partial [Rhizobiales bacterium]|nr:hypothetical protein [Hyphomicrobiales bacterium]
MAGSCMIFVTNARLLNANPLPRMCRQVRVVVATKELCEREVALAGPETGPCYEPEELVPVRAPLELANCGGYEPEELALVPVRDFEHGTT